MSDHYDRLENRTHAARESALFRDIRHVLGVAKARVPALRAQLKGFDIASLQSRAELAMVPVVREADLFARQLEVPPFGGLAATRVPLLKQLFGGTGLTNTLEGQAKDWWGCGRALYAAGLRKGSLVLNCFSYDLVPHGHMVASGAQAIGSPVVPGGNANLDAKTKVVERLAPTFYCGTATHLKALLDHAADRTANVSSLKHALVTGPMSAGLRNEFSLRGICVRQMWIRPEIGVIAFESGAIEGMTVNEGLIVEIVDPGTSKPVEPGTVGELVVSRINADYPLLRFGTGEMSAILPMPSACGRTNMRIRVPAPMSATLGIAHIREIRQLHPTLGRMQMFVRRPRGHDVVHLKVEHRGASDVVERISESLRVVTRLMATVELVEPGTLSDDEVIVDERSVS